MDAPSQERHPQNPLLRQGVFFALSTKICAEKANEINHLRREALRALGAKQLIFNGFSGRLHDANDSHSRSGAAAPEVVQSGALHQ